MDVSSRPIPARPSVMPSTITAARKGPNPAIGGLDTPAATRPAGHQDNRQDRIRKLASGARRTRLRAGPYRGAAEGSDRREVGWAGAGMAVSSGRASRWPHCRAGSRPGSSVAALVPTLVLEAGAPVGDDQGHRPDHLAPEAGVCHG